MHSLFKSLLVAGTLGSATVLTTMAPVAAQDANALHTTLQQSGADTTYVQWRGRRVSGFRGRGLGARGFGARRGFAGRGAYGRRGFAGRGLSGRGRFGYGGYGYRRRGIGAGAAVGGLAAGALLGGALAAQAAPGPVYNAPAAFDGPGRDDAYCSQKYRSYDPASGTYLGYDGKRHPCG